MADDGLIAILARYQSYGFAKPIVGFVEPGLNFQKDKRFLTFGDGSWVQVRYTDLIFIDLTESEKNRIFTLYD